MRHQQKHYCALADPASSRGCPIGSLPPPEAQQQAPSRLGARAREARASIEAQGGGASPSSIVITADSISNDPYPEAFFHGRNSARQALARAARRAIKSEGAREVVRMRIDMQSCAIKIPK